jgi:D-arabinose 1-dehydrogenase-like Zn-dependent alcohol dehydrogenase
VEQLVAGQLVAPGRVEVGHHPVPPVREGEVLVRTRLAAVCGSDVHVVFDDPDLDDLPGPPG